ncbi:hypothetical protein AARAC_003114 [Aspergillus arachidicola]|uniref:Cytochrome b5 heme-binding domain-containing protein n=1 Tax=Aspergillus arachidicola TaxID=656916 RepID=A0A2G7FQG9_9EURO|nr:hypothetical protein AARAC_003114 [Aspergillus arachidicola]
MELSFKEVAEHSTKEDLYMVVHERVHNCSSGGKEVLLDVGGQDATEAFEDAGHSDEGREILEGLLVGSLNHMVNSLVMKCNINRLPDNYRFSQPDDLAPDAHTQSSGEPYSSGGSTGFGVGLYAILLLGFAAAFFAYEYVQISPGTEMQ